MSTVRCLISLPTEQNNWPEYSIFYCASCKCVYVRGVYVLVCSWNLFVLVLSLIMFDLVSLIRLESINIELSKNSRLFCSYDGTVTRKATSTRFIIILWGKCCSKQPHHLVFDLSGNIFWNESNNQKWIGNRIVHMWCRICTIFYIILLRPKWTFSNKRESSAQKRHITRVVGDTLYKLEHNVYILEV